MGWYYGFVSNKQTRTMENSTMSINYAMMSIEHLTQIKDAKNRLHAKKYNNPVYPNYSGDHLKDLSLIVKTILLKKKNKFFDSACAN